MLLQEAFSYVRKSRIQKLVTITVISNGSLQAEKVCKAPEVTETIHCSFYLASVLFCMKYFVSCFGYSSERKLGHLLHCPLVLVNGWFCLFIFSGTIKTESQKTLKCGQTESIFIVAVQESVICPSSTVLFEES